MIDLLLLLHVLGACVLIGGGCAIVVFVLAARRAGDVAAIAGVARIVAAADAAFVTGAAIAQPTTGMALAIVAGVPLDSGWLLGATALYVAVGALWLPAAATQQAMGDVAAAALAAGTAVPARYDVLLRRFLACAGAALAGLVAILWLMLAKPL